MCSMTSEAGFVYNSDGRRDPFVPLIGVAGVRVANGAGGIASLDNVTLQGIIISPSGDKSVILNGEIMKEGDSLGGLTVITINDNKVTVKLGKETHDLRLYE